MSKLWYTEDAVYLLPARKTYAIAMDGIYLDGNLFDNNIPVLDCIAWISVAPRYSHMIGHWITFGFPSYKYGSVERLGIRFNWLPFQTHTQSDKLLYNGHPYGMGLNTIAVEMYLDIFPLTRDVVYDVSYIMEVDI